MNIENALAKVRCIINELHSMNKFGMGNS